MSQAHISDYYSQDHDRLDEHFRQFQTLKTRDYPKAREQFKAFKSGLKRHIVWEEEVLFPFFESRSGMAGSGPTVTMRIEHRQIEESLEELHKKVRKGDPASAMEEEILLRTLKDHNEKEETVLYPMLDRMATEEEKKKIFAAMEQIPLERFAVCCCHGHAH